ncbi:ABC transporter substrate-binding protein [Cryptosporangium aurantiacum]|uniref:Peptide/nickel transport system substrate-binding protein n=1 Tax=Cryptosporangium aurantiacum TaxID=134849 RepID=A0A1M7QBM4_9ACTN|nr:ABC transporter substrate-binding protein [Cryptosporangium aurantiacum]SHN27821.1 peptide/nickel transport system substrate-binding protein [Cryptosporangium aurantiacum]
MPVRSLRRTLPVLAATVAVTVAGCSSSDESTADAGPPQSGGTLKFALAVDPTCLDPQQFGLNASLNVSRQIVDSLTDQDPKTGEIKPWLAESWKVNEAATSFTFTLRTGATFSDGTPVDAAAVKTNFDAIVKLGAKAQLAGPYLAGYKSATVVDPQTVRVDFAAPSAQFLQATSTMSLGLLSASTATKTPEQRCQGDLIGSGPFVLEKYTPNQGVTLTRRKGYAWPSSLAEHKGEAYLEAIEYKIVPESGVRTGTLQSGQIDGATDIPPQDEARFEGNGFQLLVRGNPGIPFNLAPNTAKPILGDEQVRLAIQKALNRDEIVQTALSDKYQVATGSLAKSTPGWSDQSAALKFDQDGAKKILDAAGWAPGPGGIRQKSGQKLSVDVVYNLAFPPSQTILELAQQQLKAVGVELRLRQLTTGEITAAQASGDFDFLWYNVTRADPDILRTSFSTKYQNRSRLKPGPLDTVLDQQVATLDDAKRKQLVAEAQKLIITDHAYQIPIVELSQVLGLSDKVHGLRFEASSRLSFYDTWLSK